MAVWLGQFLNLLPRIVRYSDCDIRNMDLHLRDHFRVRLQGFNYNKDAGHAYLVLCHDNFLVKFIDENWEAWNCRQEKANIYHLPEKLFDFRHDFHFGSLGFLLLTWRTFHNRQSTDFRRSIFDFEDYEKGLG